MCMAVTVWCPLLLGISFWTWIECAMRACECLSHIMIHRIPFTGISYEYQLPHTPQNMLTITRPHQLQSMNRIWIVHWNRAFNCWYCICVYYERCGCVLLLLTSIFRKVFSINVASNLQIINNRWWLLMTQPYNDGLPLTVQSLMRNNNYKQ